MTDEFQRNLFDLLEAEDRALAKSKAPYLAEYSRRWWQPIEAEVPDSLSYRLSVTVAAIAPRLDLPELYPLMAWCAWTAMIDERFDRTSRPVDPTTIRASIEAALDGEPWTGTDGFYETTLIALVGELRRYDSLLTDRFIDAVREAAAAQAEHVILARQRGSAPCAEEYLDVAGRHSYMRSIGLVLLALVQQHPTAADLDHFECALASAGKAVRLANDLRTHSKDATEGTLNIVQLRLRGGARITPEHAEDLLERYCAEARTALRKIDPTSFGVSVSTLENHLRVAIGLYRIGALKGSMPHASSARAASTA
jgi:hypothetical protein